jgi:uncharacterized damage-inducible protein DinB
MTIPAELTIVFESFDRNARVNRVTLASLTMEDLTYSDGVGGFNIGQHLADIVNFRPDWLKHVSPEHAARVTDVTDGSAATWLTVKSIDELQAAFDEGDAAMRDAVLDAVREGRSFTGVYETHPAHLMQHCIVHDSHHRGQILALLRQSGRSTEERERLESASWPIWRE